MGLLKEAGNQGNKSAVTAHSMLIAWGQRGCIVPEWFLVKASIFNNKLFRVEFTA
jgi:hypothetical protein